MLRGALIAGIVALSGLAQAATPLEDRSTSADVPASLDGGVLFVPPQTVIAESPSASAALADLGTLPPSVAVRGYHVDPGGLHLFSIDNPATLGAVTALPRDVVQFDGTTYSLAFDGGAAGVPDGIGVDAISRFSGGLLLSFDGFVSISGVGFEPGDLVQWDGAVATLFLPRNIYLTDPGLNLDAFHVLPSGAMLLSFDGSGNALGTDFNANDVLETMIVAFFEVALDLDALDAGWDGANLEALHVVAAGDDNCPGVLNPDQTDTDADTEGDACDADDDGDGLSDVDEINIYLTDPLDADSDDDGIDDGDEVANGLNPNSDLDAALDPDVDGLTNLEEITVHGTDPNVADSDGDGLNDGDEINTHLTDPLDADSDDDGIDDGDEIANGLDPNSDLDAALDPDVDGLTNLEEITVHGTDPNVADSDGDGLNDGDEINIYLTDPLDADSDDDGINDGDEVNLVGTDPNNDDEDGDGALDGADNCPFVAGPQTNSDALPAGDLCQCADLDENGVVNLLDLDIAQKALTQATIGVPFNLARCNMIGPTDGGLSDCEVDDLFRISRLIEGFASSGGDLCRSYGRF